MQQRHPIDQKWNEKSNCSKIATVAALRFGEFALFFMAAGAPILLPLLFVSSLSPFGVAALGCTLYFLITPAVVFGAFPAVESYRNEIEKQTI